MEMKRAVTGDRMSGNVHSVGYDGSTKTLAVCFLDKDKKSAGAVYHIKAKDADDDSLANHYSQMSRDDVSTGSYYHKHIRGGEYVITKQ